MSNKVRTYIIAEAGVNHNGSVDLAQQLIEAAVEAGADAVKFQTFHAEALAGRGAPKCGYQMAATAQDESQLEMLKKLELDEASHRELYKACCKRGIQFLSTPFDPESAVMLAAEYDVPYLKISSGEITNSLLLLAAAATGKPMILSTGMSTLDEITEALGVLAFGYLSAKGKPSRSAFKKAYSSTEGQQILREKVTLLHCTSAYPVPYPEVNLRAMDTLRSMFGLKIGYSDHTLGIAVPIAAAARGASVIEKHFTLDQKMPGPDHKASLEPAELKAMVCAIRQVEQALGDGRKVPTASEVENRGVARRSLVAARSICKDEMFTADNVTVKRPGTGLSPMLYWDVLGKPAQHEYNVDEMIGI